MGENGKRPAVRLKELLGLSKSGAGGADCDPLIRRITTDSRDVEKGALFIAVEGYKESGSRYIEDAVRKGAVAVVTEKTRDRIGAVPPGVAVCRTDNARREVLLISRAFFGFPSNDMTLIGVTGTNGKTTFTYLLEKILQEAGLAPGVIGTVSYRYAGVERKADNTTPDPLVIQSFLHGMREGKTSHCIIEVSSHALAMERVLPSDFDLAVFTNLSQDHLDFHRTMEEYFEAKSRLFTGLSPESVAVLNTDDEYGRRLVRMAKGTVVTYGTGPSAAVRGGVQNLSLSGSEFSINGVGFRTRLIGMHNIFNILAAAAAAERLGVDADTVRRAVERFENVPGRFERVGEESDIHVFVDYAHTPDALQKLLDAAGALKTGRIITVFGCGGDRDRTKRPLMGGVVEKGSDVAIVTSDNPRTENPLAIIEDIKKGLLRTNHIVVPDRKSAIYRAIEMAMPDDIVLIAGKGHEDYQILGQKKIHFDDREVALEALRKRGR
ncbi:MAG: UDP-N-acetylmuramoyl-L-alanyl-D-glutamate--2,6-diaminopimelate ligase [Spirochaetes bacterium]|nr:UDP-N-acetylmuramoyl-L-alanyl-D-glutamate--2,6-diaminopimelate ligase [Spirochaetota bacterium]